MKRLAPAWLFTLAAGLVGGTPLMAGCADDAPAVQAPTENPLAVGADFVAIPRDPDALARARVAAKARALPPTDGQEFYVAIRRSVLNDRWFMSAFLDQYYPGGVKSEAGSTLGTRVVTFREQNDKLYLFDAAEGSSGGPVFDPEVIIEAYPIVSAYAPFDGLSGASDYVLVDPAAGLNHFNVVSDAFATPGYQNPSRFQVELSFLQNFRKLADGLAYQQVFTGYTDRSDPDGTGDTTVSNTFAASGTLSISLRHYREGAGFVATPAELGPYFFNSKDRHDPSTGAVERFHNHWNIHPGMTPIRWRISRELPKYVAAHPELAGADVVGSIERGIESWNQVFGYPVFKAELAGPDDAFGDDDKNFIIFDPTPPIGYAYANWRTNPVNGEIRGAIVYMGSNWLDMGRFHDDASTTSGARPTAPKPPQLPKLTQLQWEGASEDRLCTLFDDGAHMHPAPGAAAMPATRQLELFVQNMIAHEIGHNLGLRHNFKGSLVPPSSSLMDYTNTAERIAAPMPGTYDVAAIRLLYGLSSDAPTDPFCTDTDIATDPACKQFDGGADPLDVFYGQRLADAYQYFFDFGFFDFNYFDWASEGVLGYARAGWGDPAIVGYERVMQPWRAPIDPSLLAQYPSYGIVADGVAHATFALLYGVQASSYASITNAPVDASVTQEVVQDLRGNLLNLDGVRSIETRRLCVDVLKKLQRVDAYRALLEARAALQQQLAGADPLASDEAVLATDLLARIDAATSPYFQ